jgi:quinol monooxygenase YgiN
MSTEILTLVVTFHAKPGKETELRAALTGVLAPTRNEAGCLNYDLHASPDDPAKFLIYENWASKAHHKAHHNSPHIQALLPRLDELCAPPPQVTQWKRIG